MLKTSDALESQLKTAYFIAQNHLPLTIPELIGLVVVFAELALVVPLNSASCERGFSAQNKIKSKSRNRLRDEQVDRLMKITINGPHYAEYDYTAAKNNFRAMKDRIQ